MSKYMNLRRQYDTSVLSPELAAEIKTITNTVTIHGSLMCVAIIILMPLGGVLLRLVRGKKAVWIHASIQLLAICFLIAGFGMGVRSEQLTSTGFKKAHPILGALVSILFLAQPIFGYLHHRHFVKTQQRSRWSYLHIWYGRTLIFLGIINGGLGFRLAGNIKNRVVAYTVVAAVFGAAYVLGVTIMAFRERNSQARKGPAGEEVQEAE